MLELFLLLIIMLIPTFFIWLIVEGVKKAKRQSKERKYYKQFQS